MKLEDKEQLEINFWKESKHESPSNFTNENLVNKLNECKNFDYKVNKYKELIVNKKNILEIGAGQGWASCYLKKHFLPQAKYTTTDISKYAIDSLVHWENHFDVKIDKAYPSKSYDINEESNSFDLIFCYAAAHHFVLIKKTLEELKRLLTKDGHIIFFYEPTSSKFFYPFFYKYVNKMPHSTPEDVIIPSLVRSYCREIGLEYQNNYDPNTIVQRGFVTGKYFDFLKKFKFFQKFLPSSSDLVFWHD